MTWHSCGKHNLRRAFVDGPIDDDKKLFLKKHNQFKTRVQKTYPIFAQNGQTLYPINSIFVSQKAGKQ